MQNSELYRRGIVCPLDEVAEERLRRNDVDSATHVRLLAIPDNLMFTALCQLKLFDQINARCGTLIDDYEEEWVEASGVAAVVAAVDAVADAASDSRVAALLLALRSLAHEAEASSRPLLFIL
jgi:hypothetical protein